MTRRPARRRGLALVMVTVHAVLILSAWAAANRQTVGLIRLKQRVAARPEPPTYRDAAARRLALCHALALLKTGDPPLDADIDPDPAVYAYRCFIDIDTGPDGDLPTIRTFEIRFTTMLSDPPLPSGTPRPWTITVNGVAEGSGGDRPRQF